MIIKEYPFNKFGSELVSKEKFGSNWPIVYILGNKKKQYYIGETVHCNKRIKQHLYNPEKRIFEKINVINDDDFNKSAVLDIESSLIKFFSAEGIEVENSNDGLKEHNYYNREKYTTKFDELWEQLKQRKIVKNNLVDLKNSNLFKYSPYKSLSEDQLIKKDRIVKDLESYSEATIKVSGAPGTGKSILAVYLMKYLVDSKNFDQDKIGLVVPMTSFRNTLKKVFKKTKNLKAKMVIGPNDVIKKDYELLIVDEAHRLKRRKNIMNHGTFNKVNEKLSLADGTQIDWILKSSNKQVLFYDQNQTVHPSDVDLTNLKITKNYELKTQMRVKGGDKYISFITDIFDNKTPRRPEFKEYEFELYDDIEKMVEDIKKKEKYETEEYKGLCRMLAGYGWDWISKKKENSDKKDIKIDNVELKWNSENSDWANSKNAINEVGCIHTIQGYDLNYAGVIIGPELSYDLENEKFIIYKEKYKDKNGKKGVQDKEELKKYILNIYKVLLTRGIRGTFVYICDENLRKHFNNLIQNKPNNQGYAFNNEKQTALADKKEKYNY